MCRFIRENIGAGLSIDKWIRWPIGSGAFIKLDRIEWGNSYARHFKSQRITWPMYPLLEPGGQSNGREFSFILRLRAKFQRTTINELTFGMIYRLFFPASLKWMKILCGWLAMELHVGCAREQKKLHSSGSFGGWRRVNSSELKWTITNWLFTGWEWTRSFKIVVSPSMVRPWVRGVRALNGNGLMVETLKQHKKANTAQLVRRNPFRGGPFFEQSLTAVDVASPVYSMFVDSWKCHRARYQSLTHCRALANRTSTGGIWFQVKC